MGVLNQLKNWKYLPQKYRELIECEVIKQAWLAYRTLEDIPQQLRDLADVFVDDEYNPTLIDRYQVRLNSHDDPKGTVNQSFMDWYINNHLLESYWKYLEEYLEWLQNEYDAKLHGNTPVIYWLRNVANVHECLCGCWEVFENFPDIFEYVKDLLQLEN